MRVPSALFALVPLLGQLTQAHHDAAPRNHQPRSFKLDVRIPQRRDLLRPDGTVNVELVKRTIKQHHQRRQAQAVAATRDQTAHLNLLKRAQETEDMFHAKKARVVGRALKSGAMPVIPSDEAPFWLGAVGLGPGGSQKISNLALDTDGPKLDVYTKGSPTKCNSTYDPTKSPHAIKGASYTSGDGIAKGDYYQDSVTFGGLEVANQSFVSFTTTTNGENLEDHMLLSPGACGFVGLGFNSNHSTLVQTLINSNAIPQPFFAVSLTDTGGSVDIGAVNSSAYQGPIAWAPLVDGAKSTTWTIKTTAFTKNGKPLPNKGDMLVSFQTYSPYTTIPSSLGAAFGGSIHNETSLYKVACKQMGNITFGFNIGGQNMEMPLSSLNLGNLLSDPSTCLLLILTTEYPELMLGSPAMESFYVLNAFAHDKMGPAVGVAKAKKVTQSG